MKRSGSIGPGWLNRPVRSPERTWARTRRGWQPSATGWPMSRTWRWSLRSPPGSGVPGRPTNWRWPGLSQSGSPGFGAFDTVGASSNAVGRRSTIERELIHRSSRTAPVVAAVAAATSARADLAAARKECANAHRALGDLDAAAGDVDRRAIGLLADDPVTVHAAAAADRELAGALTELMAEAAEQDRDLAELARARARHHRDEVAAVDVEQRLAGLPGRIAELDKRVTVARSARDRLPAAAEQLAAAESVRDAARTVPVLQERAAAAAASANAATDRHQLAVDARQRLVQTRIAGMAAELAGALTAGTPCAVCGSCDHPDPAQDRAPAVTSEQVRAAEKAEASAAAERERAAQQRWALHAELATAMRLAAGRDVAAAETELTDRAAVHERLAAIGRNLDPLLGLRDAASKAQFEHGLRREDLATTLAGGVKEISMLAQRTERRAARLLKARAGHESVYWRRCRR